MGKGLRIAADRAKMQRGLIKSYEFPVKPPEIAPGVVPAGATAPVLAMDSNPYAFASQSFPGGGFPGFPYLAQLSTRAEYRAFASTLSTEMTREWIKLTSKQDDDVNSADKIKKIEDEFKRINLRSMIQQACEHDSYFGRAQLLINIRGADLQTPLVLSPRTVKQGSLESVVPVEAVWTTPAGYNALDPAAPDFYRPSKWFMLGQEVHASRLMTVITRPLPDILKPAFNFGGMSLSQLAEPYVDNWLRTRQSVADLINNFSITALATSMDQVLQGDDDGADVMARAELFTATRSNKGLMLLDKEREELVQVNTPLSGLHELQAQSQEHMCVSKGTLIQTKRGQIPIEKVTKNDEVMTRNGYAPVEWAGITGMSYHFVQIETDVSTLRVTEDHPIWTEAKQEFVAAKNVSLFQRLRKSQEWAYTENQLHGAGVFGVSQSQDIIETQKAEGCCIASFMNPILGKFQKGLTFITKMKTSVITQLKTSLFSQDQSTQQNMSQKDGIDNSTGQNTKKNAKNADQNTKHLGRKEQGFVRENAKQKTGNEAEVIGISQILNSVQEPVFNIKVKDGFLPEFFANGILVHNCSVSRMPAVVLTGISPSGLNASSEGEIRVFYDWIAAQQEAYWRDPIEVVLKVVQLHLFGEIDPDIGFEFVPLFQMTPKEESDIREANSRVDVAYVASGIIDPSEVRDRLAKDPNSGFHGLDTSIEIVPPMGEEDDLEAMDKSVSEKQHRAMEAAASGKSTLGIPEKVGKEFVSKDAKKA